MFFESYYKESLFFANSKDKFPDLQSCIESQLSENSAVGIIGGIYDDAGKFPISFISGFALDILNYRIKELEERKLSDLIDIILEADRVNFVNWIKSNSEECFLRLLSKSNDAVWVKAIKSTFKDAEGKEYWLISTRLISDMLEYMLLDSSCIFSAIIDIASKTISIYKGKEELKNDKFKFKCMNYDVVLEEFVRNYPVSSNRNELKHTLSLENVLLELAHMKSFEHIDSIKSGSDIKYVRRKFRYLSDAKRFILLTSEDITSFFVLDTVTKCLNFKGFMLRAEKFVKNDPSEKMILTFDICNFKIVNNIFGYEIGNKLLQQFSDYLTSAFFNPYFVARGDSDHFICIIEKKYYDFDRLKEFCKKELILMDKPFIIHLQCGVYDITDERKDKYSVAQMCRFAKTAQQKLNSNYLLPIAVYQDSMTDEYVMNAKIINDINKSLKDGEFKVFYQPIFDARTKKIVSAEALIRWQHPQYGFLSPGLFIPVLESHGLVSFLDTYVVKKIDELQQKRMNSSKSIVPISSNISRADMLNCNVLNEVTDIIQNSPVPNRFYRIELTESALFAIPHDIVEKLIEIKNKDIKILIDDFGSGYSSFSSMAKLPFYIAKLDMSLCQMIESNEKSGKILKNMIELCHSVDGKVIAEGVETELQYQKLKDWGCDYIQGYYFSKPIPEDSFENLLNVYNN